MIDDVDAVGYSTEVFYPTTPCAVPLWNGREVTVLDSAHKNIQLFQFPPQDQPFPHTVEQLVLDDEAEFTFAPCALLSEQLTFDNSLQPTQIDLSGFFHRVWHGVKKGARKVAEAAKKALEKVTHGTKKAAHNVEKFVREHKKEILIVTAVASAAVGAYFVSGACLAGAAGSAAAAVAAPSPSSKKKEDEPGSPVTAASPPSPLPDWVENLLKSAAPTLSLTTATDDEFENAKREAHKALDGLNQLKILTEADLAHLRKEDPTFDPRATAIEIVTNTVLNEAQRREFSKTSSAEQNWRNFIQTGHQRIDEAFITASFYKSALKAAIPPPTRALSFADRAKLGFQIISEGMRDPKIFDPNTRLDVFLKDRNITVPIENSNQTVSEFIDSIKFGFEKLAFENISQTSIGSRNQANGALPIWEKAFHTLPFLPSPSMRTEIPDYSISRYFNTQGVYKDGMLITDINGIDNKEQDSLNSANYLNTLSPGNLRIDGIYNRTNGKILDIAEALFFNYLGYSPITKDLLIKKWTEFHEKNKDRPDAKILHFCHSQGTIDTYNAIDELPKEIRDRLIVVSIAPAKIIPDEMCFKSHKFASENDLVHLGDIFSSCCQSILQGGSEKDIMERYAKAIKVRDELVILKAHEGAKGLDHEFQSPTFTPVIVRIIEDYEKHEGKYP